MDRLKGDRSLPPLGLYFDFMDRFRAAPAMRGTNCFQLPGTAKSLENKAPNQRIQRKRLMTGKDIPFNFEQFFYHVALLSPMGCGLIPKEHLTVSGDSTAVHNHACPCALPVQGTMIPSASSSLSVKWKNICLLFPPRIYASTLPWTTTQPTAFSTYGKEHCSKCKNICASSKYGRVVKTRPEWDIRLYTDILRSMDTYKEIYKQRTATERINNHILNDYGLHRMSIHTKKRYSFMTTMIGRDINHVSCFKILSSLFPGRLKTMPDFILHALRTAQIPLSSIPYPIHF